MIHFRVSRTGKTTIRGEGCWGAKATGEEPCARSIREILNVMTDNHTLYIVCTYTKEARIQMQC